jgi:O-acetyl-ADP-ribose deacetylase (regulator of RNase III)
MIKYIIGDATCPVGSGKQAIVHICNDKGGWGAGFVLALSKKWKEPERQYRKWAKSEHFKLGKIQVVKCSDDLYVINMVAQRGFALPGYVPLSYTALRDCLKQVNEFAKQSNITLHAPKFGAGLAGGDWRKIEAIINETIDCEITIYEFR